MIVVATGVLWNYQRREQNVKGLLVLHNRRHNRSYFFRPQPMPISQIQPLLVLNGLHEFIQSNEVFTIEEMELAFEFLPTTRWGNGIPSVPSWVSVNYKKTWQTQIHNNIRINCAAYCLAFYLDEQRWRNDTRIKQKALSYNLGVDTTIHQVLTLFQTHEDFAKHRLTIIIRSLNSHENYTVAGEDFMYDESKLCYLIYEPLHKHFGLCKSPLTAFRTLRPGGHFCHKCVNYFQTACACGETRRKKRKTPKKMCDYCGKINCLPQECFRNCKICGSTFKGGYDASKGEGHRCILYKPFERKEFWKPGTTGTKNPMLWVFDLESAVEVSTRETNSISSVDGIFEKGFQVSTVLRKKHTVNLVVFKNVFEDTIRHFFGRDAIDQFLVFLLSINNGNNICIAHNGSGYDARLILDAALKLNPKLKLSALARGTKFMQFDMGNLVFRDSLLHLPGSLKNLAKSFKLKTQKGYFPHLFNQECNYEYEGTLPAKKYFDMTWSVKGCHDNDEFNEWYEERKLLPWNFKEELLSYCIDDVKILADIVKQFHEICDEKFQTSPWFSTTGPSYVHKVILNILSDDENLALPDTDEVENRRARIDQLTKEHWAVLKPTEYFFARKALRGGRTDVRCVSRTLTDEERNRGCRIVYQDMVSMYPAVQLKYNYPVGTPKIFIYDPDFYPCFKHRNPEYGNNIELRCQCTYTQKKQYTENGLDIVERDYLDPEDYKNIFGFICCTIDPPKNLFHPALVTWDAKLGKCVASLELIVEQVFPTTEFQMALEMGYKVIKIHRVDHYNHKEGLWNEFIKDLYIEKMANSEPPPENSDELIEEYEDKFGMGDAVKQSLPRWKKDPVLRLVFKIMLNSGWGKHCQRPNMPQAKLFRNTDDKGLIDYFTNVENDKCKVTEYKHLGSWTYLKSQDCGITTNPDLHSTYLPAGCFVPSYGRLELYKHLHRLDKRVLYHDTDSIIYIYDPLLYNIETSETLGEWSEEDISKEEIIKFIGLGPKSYGLKTKKGSMIKIKGLSLKRCTSNLINFEEMESMLDAHLRNEYPTLKIPQMNFTYSPGHGIETIYSLKAIQFQPDLLKGVIKDDLRVYPFGYI